MKGMLSRLSRKIAGKREERVETPHAETARPPAQLLEEAIGLYRSGRLGEAESLCQQVLAGEPSNFDAMHLLGVLAQQSGNSDRAVQLLCRAVDIRPDDASARSNLGLAYRTLGRFDEAEAALRRSVELKPDWDRAHANLGVVLRARGDFVGAEAEFTAALGLNPANDDALSNLASICRETGRHDKAESLYRSAIALHPDRAEFWSNLAAVHLDRNEWKEAERCLRVSVEKNPTADTLSNLGFVLLQLGQLNEAEGVCRDALAIQADFPDALVNLALVLKAIGDLEGAEELCRTALAIDAAHIAATTILGTIRAERGDASAAEECYRRAMALDTRFSVSRFNLSTQFLARGDYGGGFALYESRFDAVACQFKHSQTILFLNDVAKRWQGGPITGRRVVIWSEQGHGDNLLMLRYLPLLKQRGAAHVIFVCEPELIRIAEGVAGIDRVIAWDTVDLEGEYDLHCPTMSLPYCFRTAFATIPTMESYVSVPSSLSREWKARLPDVAGRRVGLVWAGNSAFRDDARRSIALSAFGPILGTANVNFFSLQKGPDAQQAAEWSGLLIDRMDACEDFMDTAALVSNLDLVIASDTAMAHLVGAIGKPVWLLNRAGSDWRWGLAGERSAWYPTMRIFRQQQPLDWAPVMTSVFHELQAFAAMTAIKRTASGGT